MPRKRPPRLLVATTVGWALLFSYLLLTSDPPDLGPWKLRSFEDQGHVFGSAVLGALVFLVALRRHARRAKSAAIALLITFVFLTGLEVAQLVRPGRGYQSLDIQLNLAGALAGIGVGFVAEWLQSRFGRPG